MKYPIYFIWLLTAPDVELLYQVVKIVVRVIKIHMNDMWPIPKIGEKVISASKVDRSLTHRNVSPLNSKRFGKKKKKASVNGICSTSGKHPPSGFTHACLYSFICSCCKSIGLSSPTFAFNSSSCGLSTLILPIDWYDL